MVRVGYKFQSIGVGFLRYLSGSSWAGDQKLVVYLSDFFRVHQATKRGIDEGPKSDPLFLAHKKESFWTGRFESSDSYAKRRPLFGAIKTEVITLGSRFSGIVKIM